MKNFKFEKELKNKTILITGGAGSLGSHLTRKLLKYPIKSIRVLDIDEHSLFKLKRALNNNKVRFLLGSILDKERLQLAGDGVDFIIHAASIASPIFYRKFPIETIDSNVTGLRNILEYSKVNNIESLLFFSTSEIYGDPEAGTGTARF